MTNNQEQKACIRCHLVFDATTENFYKRNNGRLYGYCKKCFSRIQVEQHSKTKKKALDHIGSTSCVICGYNKCVKALHFHHLDPEAKEFGILKTTQKFELLKDELGKCVVVCSNCHTEIHDGMHPQYLIVKDL